MHKRTLILIIISVVACHTWAARSTLAQGPQEWIAESGDWNTGSNWFNLVVPDAGFGDTALIDNGVAMLTGNADFPVGGVAVGPGTFQLTAAANLSVVDATLQDASATGFFTVAGSGNLTLADNANVTVEGRINLNGVTDLAGPNVTFATQSNLDFGFSSVYNTTISSPTMHSAFTADGTATLRGALNVEFSGGVNPGLGDAWTLVDAGAIEGTFSSVQVTGTSLASGLALAVTTAAGGKGELAQIAVEERLVLAIDRQTGSTTIRNLAATGVAVEGYTVESVVGALAPGNGAWNSLEDQGVANWFEVPSTANGLGELENTSAGSLTISGGGEQALGAAYDPILPFGSPLPEDLVFKYRDAATKSVLTGLVEYSGPVRVNNLVLSVDPATGNAEIANASPTVSIDLQGYSITSEEGSLLTSFESDLPDTEWAETAGSANGVAELNFVEDGAATLAPGATISLTGVFSPGGAQDLEFQFRRALAEVGDGDFNQDGVVDAADYPAWRDGLGTIFTPADYDLWKQNFGNVAGGGSGGGEVLTGIVLYEANLPAAGSAAAVPEPGSLLVSLTCLLGIGVVRTARKRNV